jgi:hypothetical protein
MTVTAPATTVEASKETTSTAPTDNATTSPAGVVLAPSTGSEAKTDTTSKADTTATEAWLAGLDTESRELATKKGWKDQNAAIKSYSELEKMRSTVADVKTETPVKHTADAYKFTLPDNAKDIGYSDTFANGFRDLAVEADISPAAASKVHDWYTKFAGESLAAQQTDYVAQVTKQVSEAQAALVTEWGAENNPAFKRNVELAQRAMTILGVTDRMVEAGVLIDSNGQKTVADAQMMKMFAQIGKAMYAEDTIHGAVATSGVNPFDPKSSGADAQKLQGDLIRNDPEKALLLISNLAPSDQAMWLPVLSSIKARVKK